MSLKEMNAEATLALGQRIANVLVNGGAARYGIQSSVVTALSDGDTVLGNAILRSNSLRDESKSATEAKSVQRGALSAQIASIHATVLNNPAVTDDMLLALGFAPRRGGTKAEPRVPLMVTGVVAEPAQGTSIRVSWDRGANAKSTMFVVESSPDNLSFTPIKTVTRVSYVVPDCPPGEPIFFRVVATTSTDEAQPSQSVGVYTPALPSKVELKLAA